MSATKFVEIDGRGFWALDDALDVWLAYLVDQIGDRLHADDAWIADLRDQWVLVAAISDYGITIDFDTQEHRDRIREFAEAARRVASEVGDVTVDRLRQWLILDDIAVSDGHARRPEGVQLNRILEVADGFIALLDGRLPPDPPAGWWFLGTGEGMSEIGRSTRPSNP
ncbi:MULTISPECIES: hypothetical protein [unclassified Nocardia]|uniref:hypothetical protein n=1 Tax=unclassified Nocardia TaxID=2637762 RepID=UPI001CE4836D|nr:MULTISPECIES: hypothetical protein [unclassified Nocardia]